MLNLPQDFQIRLKSEIQPGEYLDSILHSFQDKTSTTFRTNTILKDSRQTISQLEEQGFKFQQAPFSSTAYSLLNKSQKELQQTESYKKGYIYLQSYASQIPVIALDPQPYQKVLDLTAAPGSKTSQIAALMNLEGELHANDLNTIRYNKLIHNLKKLGAIQPANNYLKTYNKHGLDLLQDFPDQYFDKMLLDVPCSGECRFNDTYPKSYQYWSLEHSQKLSERQSQLLQAAWPKLKPGGEIVYSTCTYTIQENEQVIQSILESFPDQIQIQELKFQGLNHAPYSNINLPSSFSSQIQNCYRIIPNKDIEGFFIAKLQKCTK